MHDLRRRMNAPDSHTLVSYRFLLVAPALLLLSCVAAPNASAPGRHLPTEAELTREPSPAREWGERVTADDARTRAAAAAELAEAGDRSLPLLRRFMHAPHEDLRQEAFGVAYRIGPKAIPLLSEMLEDHRVSNRRRAADLLIDLAPD